MHNKDAGNGEKQNGQERLLSRREAIKRIAKATMLTGVVMGGHLPSVKAAGEEDDDLFYFSFF